MVEKKIKDLLPRSIPIVIGDLPGGTRDSAAIKLYDGAANEHYFKHDTVFRPVIKIVVRNQSYEQAHEWIELIKRTLNEYSDDYFMSILLSGYPMYLGKDEQKLHEFQIVFNIRVKE